MLHLKKILVCILALCLALCAIGCDKAAKESAPDAEGSEEIVAPFPYALCWSGKSADGEYALRYTYYPITGSYAYKNELTYVAVGIKTSQELERFSALANGYFSLSASADGSQSFNALVGAYDDAFFQEKGIVVIYIPSESTSFSYQLADATLDGEELHLTIAEVRPESAAPLQPAGWFMVVELPNETISQANYFSAGK